VAGKEDWIARALPTEGEKAGVPVGADVARTDVVTCSLDEPVGTVHKRVEASPYPFALVVSKTGVLLGRLRQAKLERHPDATAEEVMEAGPSTMRAGIELSELVERLRKGELSYALLSLPDGKLVGVVPRADAEARLGS
jgi:hypothetical protein